MKNVLCIFFVVTSCMIHPSERNSFCTGNYRAPKVEAPIGVQRLKKISLRSVNDFYIQVVTERKRRLEIQRVRKQSKSIK